LQTFRVCISRKDSATIHKRRACGGSACNQARSGFRVNSPQIKVAPSRMDYTGNEHILFHIKSSVSVPVTVYMKRLNICIVRISSFRHHSRWGV